MIPTRNDAMRAIRLLCYHHSLSSLLYPNQFRPMPPPLRTFSPLPFSAGFWKGVLTQTNLFPVYWGVLGIGILIGDYVSGPAIQFPILFLIPVSLASWYSGYRWGLAFAVTMPLIRLYYGMSWPVSLTAYDASINTVIRILVLGGAAFLVSRTARQSQELARRVKVLEGILPVCSFCKKIRDQHGNWSPMEQYITERSEAQFTHGFCPECGERHYGEFLKPGDGPV